MSSDELTRRLLDEAGTTYAEEAGIALADKPMPLFELLVLCMLASKPIDATIATKAAKEIFGEKLRTPDAVLNADRKTMIDAFGRAGYARYDESSADRLVDIATFLRDEYRGDMRTLASCADYDVDKTKQLLKDFKGIGDTGADIYLREVQDVWTWARPYLDERALGAAKDLGLPGDVSKLGHVAGDKCAPLAAALVRVSLDDELRKKIAT